MKNLVIFPHHNHSCGYCGFNINEDFEHYCDGFGHSIVTSTGKVEGYGCLNCQQGMYCEKFEDLERNIPRIMENDQRLKKSLLEKNVTARAYFTQGDRAEYADAIHKLGWE